MSWSSNAVWARSGALVAAVAFAGLAATSAGTAATAQETILKLGHDQVTDHTYHATTRYFAGRVAELTDGEVKVSIFPGGTLGTDAVLLGDRTPVADLPDLHGQQDLEEALVGGPCGDPPSRAGYG